MLGLKVTLLIIFIGIVEIIAWLFICWKKECKNV